MFENIIAFFKNLKKSDKNTGNSKDAAKERLHLVLMQDRANVSADFLDLMRQEIIDVIKKYIEVDEKEIDVRLTNKQNDDGTTGAPALYANIPIVNIKQNAKQKEKKEAEEDKKVIEEAKQIIEETKNENTNNIGSSVANPQNSNQPKQNNFVNNNTWQPKQNNFANNNAGQPKQNNFANNNAGQPKQNNFANNNAHQQKQNNFVNKNAGANMANPPKNNTQDNPKK